MAKPAHSPNDAPAKKVVDAQGLVLGRLASTIAKDLRRGDQVVIVNAEKAIITGTREFILERYRHRRERGSREWGPYYPRRPDHLVRRTIRGMLRYDQGTGRQAYGRLRVHLGVPDGYTKAKKIRPPEADRPRDHYLTVEEVSRELGWR
ncbi:MAG: 50S ribosomal protein L13 [Euryarchaeota archaeon]|nr:50S ribosomal protein L13 [Euryarchaeota archaeon]